ncbi:MAG: lipopolysaccharide kinase InaA family protein [Pseudomonadales bacterium]
MRRLTIDVLAAADHALIAPFSLVLDDGTFEVVEILRNLPGRRLTVGVCGAGGTPGVLKVFYGTRARRDFQRARRGLQALASASVPTVEIAAQGRGDVPWLLFPRLPGVTAPASADCAQLAAMLGRLHHAGFSHGDLHLGNFLRTPGGELLAIDADTVVPRVLSRRAGYRELAVLLAQYPIPQTPELDPVAAAYLRGRALPDGALTTRTLHRLLRQARAKRVEHYLRKTLRSCSLFERREEQGQRLLLRREVASLVEVFARDPERYFGESAVFLKRGNSATVVKLNIQGVPLVAKRYNLPTVWHRLRRLLRPRARFAWRNALRLAFLGIPTALPLGLLETGSRGNPGPAYLLMEQLRGKDLATLTASGSIDGITVKEVADILGWLKEAELLHGDLKSTNLLLDEGRLHLIDVDAVRRAPGGHRRDRQRLLANWSPDSDIVRRLAAAIPP